MAGDAIERTGGYVSGPAAATEPRRISLETVTDARRVILVEGVSDQIALDAVADRGDGSLETNGTMIAPMGGAHAIDTFVELIGPHSPSPRHSPGYSAIEPESPESLHRIGR